MVCGGVVPVDHKSGSAEGFSGRKRGEVGDMRPFAAWVIEKCSDGPASLGDGTHQVNILQGRVIETWSVARVPLPYYVTLGIGEFTGQLLVLPRHNFLLLLDASVRTRRVCYYPVFAHLDVIEVLVDGGELLAKRTIQLLDAFGVALHGVDSIEQLVNLEWKIERTWGESGLWLSALEQSPVRP